MRPTQRFLLGMLLVLPGIPALGASPGDEWFGTDKAKHFAVCTVLAGAGYGGGALLFDAPSARWITGAGLAMGAGLVKELYDTRSGGSGFSVKDLTWDAVGTATGLGVAYLVDRFVFGRDEPASASAITGGEASASLDVTLRLGAPLVPNAFGRRGLAPVATVTRVRSDGAAIERSGDVSTRVFDGQGLATPRLALDEPHELLALKTRVHQHHGSVPAVTAGDEHGDLSARALVHATGGQDVDLLGQAPLGERTLEPARQIQRASSSAAAHEALAADEDLHLPRRVSRSIPAVVLHPSSASESRATYGADAPLRVR
ncbi:hypothetical protein JY651_03710 [Pyxidicoccus parkwayensis]|uniref:Lipoprotein n=1 Tax=Pyxidicoccus parkwayensis TaxID=2813578 RepID=A0ABX7P1W3_9BACT|nr:hypothetical protein [Pyxidicoccus parkwaysis]QSQ24094.1 hypothetical protein JY651_03710 [Pyxidicoccus parkwaysis]